jgi:hypothetical protein
MAGVLARAFKSSIVPSACLLRYSQAVLSQLPQDACQRAIAPIWDVFVLCIAMFACVTGNPAMDLASAMVQGLDARQASTDSLSNIRSPRRLP